MAVAGGWHASVGPLSLKFPLCMMGITLPPSQEFPRRDSYAQYWPMLSTAVEVGVFSLVSAYESQAPVVKLGLETGPCYLVIATSGKVLDLSVAQFPHPYNGG